MKTNRVVIIQCRLTSTRFPQKAIKQLGSKTVLEWVLNSMKKVPADRYFVATDEHSFSVINEICKKNNFECFSGSLEDVLKRFCDLLQIVDAETVIRATADNPFLFYEAAIDSVEEFERRNKKNKICDYLTYQGLPHGSGVEIFSKDSLLKAASQTSDPYDHEHVGPALYNHKENFKCEFVPAPKKYNYPDLRTTIDTYSDFLRANSIVEFLGEKQEPYTTEEIIQACNIKQVQNPVIFAPSVTKGHGTGHLHRCLNAALNKPFYVYIPQDKSLEEADQIISEYKNIGLKESQIISQLPDESYPSIIVADTFKMTKTQYNMFSNCKTIISIDEGSEYSDFCEYLLDVIPSYEINRKSNLTDSSFIQLPKNKKENNNHSQAEEDIKKILICFGGEDPKGFTIPLANVFAQAFPVAKIVAIMSNENNQQIEKNVNVVKPILNLKEHLYEYDIVVTHYGLTAFEAIYAGCGVILLPTTKLHKNLAEKYKIPLLQNENITAEEIKQFVKSNNLFPSLPINTNSNSLGDFIQKISEGQKLLCPICTQNSNKADKIIARNNTRTYRRCKTCGMTYMSFSLEDDKSYEKSYFFEDYKKQYGKTYQEDFESIKKQGLRRIENINSISKIQNKNVFDIGCAYGPFLSAAADYKAVPFGTDISEDAVKYVRNELNYPACTAAFPEINISEQFGLFQFDIVTMWYVIEHFKNLDSVLKKINSILKKDGVFAFSTPSGEGISAKSNKDNFYQNSPTDHYSIWEPSKANSILEKYGFEVVKVVSTGHHPERFPCIKNSQKEVLKDSLKWKFVEKYSKLFNLGDTVEFYCVKKRNCNN